MLWLVLVQLVLGSPDVIEAVCKMKSKFVPRNETYPFTLPALPYPLYYLGKVLPAVIVDAHYHHHHQGYVNKLNAYLDTQPVLQNQTLLSLLEAAPEHLAIERHAGGDYNHYLYWEVLTNPQCARAPEGPLLEKLLSQWGSLEAFQQEFAAQSKTLFGSGWVWLCVEQEGSLAIKKTWNHVNPLSFAEPCNPILTNDVWEHAYYLKYQWDRAQYVEAFWSLVDWARVEQFYEDYAVHSKPVPI